MARGRCTCSSLTPARPAALTAGIGIQPGRLARFEAAESPQEAGARMAGQARVLLVSGSTRSGSANTAVLRTAQAVASEGLTTVLYEGLADLPAFNPDDDHEPLPTVVADLRQQIRAADAALFCTPEYAGTLPGSFKNLLDWTVGGGELYGKPVAWINAAATGRGGGAVASLKSVLGYVGADIAESACIELPVRRDTIGADGLIGDPLTREQIAGVCSAIQVYLDRRPDRVGNPERS